MDFSLRLCLGMIAGTAVGVAAHRARALTAGGAVAAAIVGTAAVAAGWGWAALLILYFVASTLLSRFGRGRKQQLTGGMIEKPGPRDARQVMANGLLFFAAAVGASTGLGSPDLWMAAGAGSLAASAADTWGTELGTLFGGTPRSILNGKPLRVGQSGGITAAGSAASLGGAVFIAAILLADRWPTALAWSVLAAGAAGAFADSLIGATAQQRRWCDACEQPTEMFIHRCGAVTRKVGGFDFLENDAVNFVANAVGSVVATAIYAGVR